MNTCDNNGARVNSKDAWKHNGRGVRDYGFVLVTIADVCAVAPGAHVSHTFITFIIFLVVTRAEGTDRKHCTCVYLTLMQYF